MALESELPPKDDLIINKSSILNLLTKISVLCRSNNKKFTNTERISAINDSLKDSPYKRTDGDLFVIYSKKPLSEFKDPAILISSHIDCHDNITRCFSQETNDSDILKGTYDNSITNLAILSLMVENVLNNNVIVAFTGDEEVDSNGAKEVITKLAKYNIKYTCIVLDVTNQGFKKGIDFTIENNFCGEILGRHICNIISSVSNSWGFVPADLSKIPTYVPEDKLISEKVWLDESWEYKESGNESFSFCLPVKGIMHSDKGVLVRYSSLEKYIRALNNIIENI